MVLHLQHISHKWGGKKVIFIFLLFCAVLGSNRITSQQDALFSQYMFNPFAINPAYAGSRNAMSAVMLYRNQWVGMQGAPQIGTIAMHSPIQGKKFSLGLNMFGEEVGPNVNSGIMGTYAYAVKLFQGKLSFGLRGGVFGTRYDKNLLIYDDPNDIHNTGGVLKAIAPNFDFGTYYYTTHFYLGMSVNHLAAKNLQYDSQTQFKLDEHIMLTTGYAWVINPDLILKPSTMVKFVPGAPVNYDINCSVLFNKVFWAGASYRSSKSIVLITEYNISDFLRIGYSYDFELSTLKKYNSGSHELFVGCDFNLKLNKSKSVSPRYL